MKRTTIVAVLAVILWAAPIAATVLISADLPELVSESHTIVQGQVVSTEARSVSGSRSIETVVTLAADDYLKGDLGPRVILRVPGGQMGFRRTVLVGAPSFRPGDRVVLFLAGNGPSLPWIVGLNQGVYRVRTAPRPAVGKWSDALQVSEDQPNHARSSASGAAVPLSAFKARVRALVSAEGAR